MKMVSEKSLKNLRKGNPNWTSKQAKFIQVIDDDQVSPKHKLICKKCKGIGEDLEDSSINGTEVKCSESGEIIGYMPEGWE